MSPRRSRRPSWRGPGARHASSTGTRRRPTPAIVQLASAPEPALVVVAGGDGTIRDAATALAGRGSPWRSSPAGPATSWRRPSGSGASGPRSTSIRSGRERTIDLGSARWGPPAPDAATPDSEGVFVVGCGMGLDARIMAAAQHEWKRRMRFGAYVGAAIGELTRLSTAVFRVVADGKELEIRGYLVLVVNAGDIIPGRVGPRRPLDPADGRLELIVLGARAPTRRAALRGRASPEPGRAGRARHPPVGAARCGSRRTRSSRSRSTATTSLPAGWRPGSCPGRSRCSAPPAEDVRRREIRAR